MTLMEFIYFLESCQIKILNKFDYSKLCHEDLEK